MSNTTPKQCSKEALPSYKKPPVVEVVSGMRFNTPEAFTIPYIGLLWNKFKSEYPITQHAPPIGLSPDQIPLDQTTGFPLPRVWFINEQDNQLIQFQPDRFYFNWRCRNDLYPRYSHVIINFEHVRNTLESFFHEFKLGELVPIECELTYINHIPKGQGWETINDLSGIFKDFTWTKSEDRFLPNPAGVAWRANFQLPEKKGQLIASLKRATRKEDNMQIIIFELIARGIDEQKDSDAVRRWFDLAHEWIVRGFADFTTPEIQNQIWERENA